MEKLDIKRHKRVIRVVETFFKKNPFILKIAGVNGFSLDVRGKLGAAGNSKKRHYAFSIGSVSFTSKNHKLSMLQTTIRTHTGVLGVTAYLSY
jgi:ribosomal protein S3